MLDGSLLCQKHITKWTKNTQKCPKQRDNNMSYVSQDMMKYTYNRPKKHCKMPPQQRDKYCKMFLSPLTVRLIEKTTVQNFIR